MHCTHPGSVLLNRPWTQSSCGGSAARLRAGELVVTAARRSAAASLPKAWALRHAITEGLRAQGEVLGFDLSVRPSDLPALRAGVRELAAGTDPALVVADFGHWGDGGIHANVVVPGGHEADPHAVERLRSDIYAMVTDTFGGSWSAEHGVGPLNAAEWTATVPAAEAAALRSLRDVVDPMRILGHPGLPFG